MVSTNVSTITGNIAVEPIFTPKTATKKATLWTKVGVNGIRKGQPTQFIPVQMWSGLAETMTKFLHLGKEVSVTGRLSFWFNKETGKNNACIVAEKINLGNDSAKYKAANPSQKTPPDTIGDDDIPF